MAKKLFTGTRFGAYVWAFVFAVVVWEFGVRLFNVPKFLLPPPSAVLARLVEERALFLDHAFATARAALGGFLLAASCAFALAIILARSTKLESLLFPYLVGIKVTPVVALAPLLAIWFGYGITTRVVVAALISFFPVVVNTLVGLKSSHPDMIALMRSYSASELDVLTKVRIPTALPFIFSSLRATAPTSLIGAIVAEIMASDKGLGYLLMLAKGYMNTERLFGCIIVAACLGFVLFSFVTVVERRVIRWHESQLET